MNMYEIFFCWTWAINDHSINIYFLIDMSCFTIWPVLTIQYKIQNTKHLVWDSLFKQCNYWDVLIRTNVVNGFPGQLLIMAEIQKYSMCGLSSQVFILSIYNVWTCCLSCPVNSILYSKILGQVKPVY
jgi:hypothetical protein